MGKLDEMLYERLTSVYVQLTLTQRLLVREHLRDVIKTAEALGWRVADDISDGPRTFTSAASLTFQSPDKKEVKVSPVHEVNLAQADVAALLAEASPSSFPNDWRPPAED
jgi:hypothetical protein